MKLRYFVLDRSGQLQEASQTAIRGVWEGKLRLMCWAAPTEMTFGS